MDKKRILIIISFTVFCAILGFIIYKVFFAPKEKPRIQFETGLDMEGQPFPEGGELEQREITETQTKTLEDFLSEDREKEFAIDKSIPKLKRLISDNIVGSNIDKNGMINFYNQTDGKFYKLGPDGIPQQLNDKIFYNVQNVTWSPKKNESIIEYPDGANIYYNFETNKQSTLPKHWEEFTFAPEGDKIASKSIGLSPENRWLITSNPDGTNISLIEPIGENADKVKVDWSPSNQIVALSRTGEALGAERQEVLMVGLNGENFRSITVEGRGLESQWSPEGKKLLYSVYNARNDFKPELWIVNAQGDDIGTERKVLGLNTWAEKCAFANERFVYCAVPSDLKRGSGFAPGLADNTPDLIYKIDLQTGIKTEIPNDDFNVINKMFVGQDENKLFFTDKLRSGLFELEI